MKQQKTRRAKTLFTLVALVVVLMSNVFVGRAEEPDPRILWIADPSIGIIRGFAVHPNGNVLAYREKVVNIAGNTYKYFFDIDGKTGKVIKEYPIITDYLKTQSIGELDISDDGQYLALSGGHLYEFQTEKIYQFGRAGYVKFIPNTNIIAYASWDDNEGRNPSIVMLNIETKEKKTIYTGEEDIDRIAFSPDGKYMATAGTKEKSDGDYYTVFKLWDAQKLTLIQELKRFDGYFGITEINFSLNNNFLAFLGIQGLTIFNMNEYSIIDNIPLNFYGEIGEVMTSFSFLNNEELIIQTQKINLYNLITKERKEIFDFHNYGKLKFTPLKDKLIVLTHYRKENLGPITALDLEKLLTNIEEKITNDFIVHYDNFVLKIIGLETININSQIEIFDIQGNLIKKLDMPSDKSEISIPLKLPIGTYLINITSAYKKLSSKFIVTK